jgi:hypothetical protein
MVSNQIGSQGAGTGRKVGGDHGIEPPVLVGFIDKDGKGTVNNHAAGQA